MGFMARDLWLHDGSPGRPPLPPPPPPTDKFSGVAHKAPPPQHLTLVCFLSLGCIYRGARAGLGTGKRCLHPHLSAETSCAFPRRSTVSVAHIPHSRCSKRKKRKNKPKQKNPTAFLTHLLSQRDICCAQAACFYANPRETPCATLFLLL